MKKISIIMVLAAALPLSAGYWSDIQEYLPNVRDCIPECVQKRFSDSDENNPSLEEVYAKHKEEPVAVIAVEEPITVIAVEEPAIEEVVVVKPAMDVIKSVEHFKRYCKSNNHPKVLQGAHQMLMNLIKYSNIQISGKVATTIRLHSNQYFRKPRQCEKMYFRTVDALAKSPLLIDDGFFLNELKYLQKQVRHSESKAFYVWGHLSALHAIVKEQNPSLEASLEQLMGKMKPTLKKRKAFMALAAQFQAVIDGLENKDN